MRLTVGKTLESFTLVSITSDEILHAANSTVIVYLDRDTNDRIVDYYRGVKAVLQGNNNQLLVILAPEESNITKSIVALCMMYECFNIYKETKGIALTREYIESLLARKSTRKEVEMYISKESVAVDSITDVLLKLKELSNMNDIDELREYVADNLDIIDEFPRVFSELKSLMDPTNKVHEEDFNRVKEELDKVKEELDDALRERARTGEELRDKTVIVEQLHSENEKIKSQLGTTNRMYSEAVDKMKSLELDNQRLQETLDRGDSAGISLYATTRLTMVPGNRAKLVLYFKEISRPYHFNSFILKLRESLNMRVSGNRGKGRPLTKLIIYDDRKDFLHAYGNQVRVFGEENYFAEKLDAANIGTVVFTDTNPVYLSDMLTQGNYDYYIIVDRLGQKADLLDGPNVIKFYAFSSNSEYLNFSKANPNNNVIAIVSQNSMPLPNTIQITHMMDYPKTDSASMSKWVKMVNPVTAKAVFDEILEKGGFTSGRR